MDIFDGWNNYPRPRGRVHQADEQSLAGLGDLFILGFFRDGTPAPWSGVLNPVAFAVREPLGETYGFAITDQRHRAVFNGIWQMGYGFQLSGLYFFGSGQRFETTFGGDALNTGGTVGSLRARPASAGGGVVPRNDLVGEADPSRRHAAAEAVRAGRPRRDRRHLSRCSTCSTTRTTGRTRRPKAARRMGTRRSIRTSRISRGCCSWDSASRSRRDGAMTGRAERSRPAPTENRGIRG